MDCYAKIITRLPYKFCSPHYTWFLINNLESGTLVRIKVKKVNSAFEIESKQEFLKVCPGKVVQSKHNGSL
jgi:hypothetical protein